MKVYCACGGTIIGALCNYCGDIWRAKRPEDMLCYKDKCWCSRSESCGEKDCHRKISREDRDNSEHLRLPLCLHDFGSDKGCYVKR